jgi:peptidoglycan/LPS O-acetylase OafA/YrhL
MVAGVVGRRLSMVDALHVLSVQTWIPVTFNGQLTHEGAFHLSWSISTEIMLYLFFALFAVLTSNHWRFGKLFRFAIAGAGILYLFAINKMLHSPDPFNSFKALLPASFGQLTEAQWHNWFYYLSPYSRIIDFTLGACAAHVVMRYRPYLSKYQPMFRWAANLALTGLVWLYLRPFLPQVLVPHAYYTQVAAAAFFAVILLNCEGNSGLNRVLSSASLVFLGEISFSLYLFHPLLARFAIFWPDRPFEPDLMPILLFNMAISGFTAVAFAYGMYRLVEMPGQRILRRLLVRTPMLEGRGVPLGVINRAP